MTGNCTYLLNYIRILRIFNFNFILIKPYFDVPNKHSLVHQIHEKCSDERTIRCTRVHIYDDCY